MFKYIRRTRASWRVVKATVTRPEWLLLAGMAGMTCVALVASNCP
jgi:hypothetical protein